jgi:hypothetical protein
MSPVAPILFAAAFTYVVSLVTGRWLLRALGLRLFREEERFLGFVLGAALLSLLVFVLTAAGLAYPGVFLAAGAILIGAGGRWGRHAHPPAGELTPVPPAWRLAFWALYGVFAVLYLGNALAPDVSPDGPLYHVSLPALYLRHHGFPWIVNHILPDLSQGVEMLFLFAFAFGRHSAAAMVHLLFGLATPLGMLAYARRMNLPRAGVIGALLFFLSPAVGRLATSPYVDVAAAGVVFAVFYLLEIWREQPCRRLFIPLGLLAGFAYAIKYTVALVLIFAAGYVGFYLWRSGRLRSWPRAVLTMGFFASLMMAPWMLKNLVMAGNPMAPFGNRYFPNPYLSVELERQYVQAMAKWGAIKPWECALDLTMGNRLEGFLGPVFLLSPLLLLALRQAVARRLLMALLPFLLIFPATLTTRHLVPALPFAALALALVLVRWPSVALAVLLAHAVLSWPSVATRYVRAGWQLTEMNWKAALRREPEASFLRRLMPGYESGLMLEAKVPAGERVFSFDAVQTSYHTREIVVGWMSSFGKRLDDALVRPMSDVPDLLVSFRFDAQPAARFRLVATRSGERSWSVSELRVFRQGREIGRAPGWRLRASPNPWDVRLAFDGNPVTKWSSNEPRRPGMFIEAGFAAPETIDQVTAELAPEQDAGGVRLELDSGSGQWRAVSVEPVTTPALRSRLELRRAATTYFKENGIHWLFVNDANYYGPDFRVRKELWRFTEAASSPNGARLYKLD